MAKITLTGGFTLIPEGEHVFQIIETNYKPDFGKLEIKMKTAKGQTHTERFTLIKSDGSVNDKAYNALSFFARTALQNYSIEEIEPNDLVGHFIKCTVTHDVVPSNTDPSKTVTFIRLGEKSPADGFETAPTAKEEKSAPTANGIDLDTLLDL